MKRVISLVKGSVLTLLALMIIVGFHEYVHYFWGQYFDAKVSSFSLGFGTELIGWTDSEGVRWKISAIPLGGYVAWADELQLRSLPTFQSLIVVLSAPLANIFVVAIAYMFVQIRGNVSAESPLSEKKVF